MTPDDESRYAEEKKDWNHKKRHVYLLPHDEYTLSEWWKGSKWLSKGMLLIYGGLILIFVLIGLIVCAFSGQFDAKVLLNFALMPVAFFILLIIYSWLFWTNCCPRAYRVYLLFFMAIPWGVAHFCPRGFKWLGFLVVSYLGLKLCKIAFFAVPKPKAEEFDSEKAE